MEAPGRSKPLSRVACYQTYIIDRTTLEKGFERSCVELWKDVVEVFWEHFLHESDSIDISLFRAPEADISQQRKSCFRSFAQERHCSRSLGSTFATVLWHPNIDSRRVSTLSTRMSHQIRLEDDVYERIKTNKRDDESFSDAVERLIGGRSLSDLRDVFDEDQVSKMRDAIEHADQQDRDEVRDVAERFE